jgi:carboxymethylenebutenolidase
VLLYIDAFGVRPRIAEMADRIAGWGYTVLAPNVFHREGSVAEVAPGADLRQPGEREKFFGVAGPRIARLTPDLVRRDAPAYLAALREHAERSEVGVVGYCMGARLAVRTAATDAGVVSVAGFHGGGLAIADDPASPHLLLPQTHAEYVFGHADQDRSMDADAVTRLGAALSDAGLTATNEVYEGAPHGYSMSDTSAYHEEATERSFAELHALLDRTLTR